MKELRNVLLEKRDGSRQTHSGGREPHTLSYGGAGDKGGTVVPISNALGEHPTLATRGLAETTRLLSQPL